MSSRGCQNKQLYSQDLGGTRCPPSPTTQIQRLSIRTAVTAEVIPEESNRATQLPQNHYPSHIIFTKLYHSLKFYSLGIDVGEGE